MTTKESYDILERATAALQVNRADHRAIEQALAVYAQLIAASDKPPETTGK
jgi:hypothetical protein